MRAYIENRIQELYKADSEFCKDRWDMAKLPFERSLARGLSNEVTFARQELQAVLKEMEKPSGPLTWDELLYRMGTEDITVTVINPAKKGDEYKTGKFSGFKAGIFGGGHSNYKKAPGVDFSTPHTYNSNRQHWIKKPKVLVAYNSYVMFPKSHQETDWIDFDNCTFTITPKKPTNEGTTDTGQQPSTEQKSAV